MRGRTASNLAAVVCLCSAAVTVAYLCVDSPDRLNGTDVIEDALIYNGSAAAATIVGKQEEDERVTGSDNPRKQIDLLHVHRVSGLTFKGTLYDQLKLSYSTDGRVWTNYTDGTEHGDMTTSGTSGNSTPLVKLSTPFQARYLRVESEADNGFESVRIEVYGCLVSPGKKTVIKDYIQSGQQEWFPSNNPYVVTDEITIGASSRLTVHAGVKVLFAENASMLVEGQLDIEGSATKPAVFSSLYGPKWDGISVYNGSVYITHAVMEDGFELSTPKENSDTVTFLVNNSKLVFDKVDMAARLFEVNITNSELNIQSLTFSISNGTSKNSSEENGSICIQNSTILSKGSNAAVSVSSDRNVSNHSFKVLKSQIIGEGDGVNVTSKTNTFNLVIEGTTFKTRGVGLSANGQFNIVRISGNKFNVNGSAVDLSIGEKVKKGRDNNVHGSHRFGYVGLNWRQEKQYKTRVVRTKVHLARNIITGSKVRVACPYTMVQPANISNNVFDRSVLSLGTPHVVIRRNIFRRHTPSIEYDGETYKHHDIDATYNYWGCKTTAMIGKKIWDYTNNTNLPRITVLPYFKDRAMRTLVNKTSFFICRGKIGGPVGGKLVLSRDKSPYVAVSDIHVTGQDSLTVEAGVKILFKEKVRIVVEGSLFLNGSHEMPVQMLSETLGKPWGGLILGGKNKPAVRLTGGTDEREGAVLVWSRSRYRPICAHRDKEFNQSHGHVVCRMAGYDPSGGVTVKARRTFSGASPEQYYSYASIKCNGNESDLVYCDGEESGCSISFGDANKPSVRCDGDKLYRPDQGFISNIVMRNVKVNDTAHGININGNVSVFENVTSQFSRSNGITFDSMFTAKHLSVIRNVDASYNDKDGIVINSDKSYRMFRLEGCSLNQNKGSGLRLAGYPTVRIEACNISGNGDGIYSSYHSIVNLTVHSSTLHHNTEHAVYFKYGEIVPLFLWSNVYRAEIHLLISNSTFSQRYRNFTTWPGLYEWNSNEYCLICIYSWNGTLQFHDNVFSNSTNKYILKLRLYTTKVEIHKNTIVNNSAGHALLVESYVDYSYRELPNSTVSIRDNVFENNRGSSVIVLKLEDNYEADVSRNHLINNYANISLWLQMKGATVENNTFINPLSSCEINGPSDYNITSVERLNDFNLGRVEMVQEDVCNTWSYSEVCGICLRRRRPNDVMTTSDISSNNTDGTTATTLIST